MENGFFCGSAVGNFLVLLTGIGRQNSLVLHDGFGCIGCAVSGKIVGGGKQDELDFGQWFDDQRRGGGFGNAQGEVEAFGDEVDMAVVEDEVERDFGITLAVFCQPCAHITTCKPQGHGNAQHTLRRVGAACRFLGGGVQGIQRVAALAVVFFACFGQVEVAAVAAVEMLS